MRVQDLMTPAPITCSWSDSADVPARIMWEHDCGIVPVLDADGQLAGAVTDRDLCMAAYLQGTPLAQIPVATCMTHGLSSCRPQDDVAKAERLMSEHQVHRLPVVDESGSLVGIISLGDIARQFSRRLQHQGASYLAEELVHTMAAISQPREDVRRA
jgi:CBS domain-containing protein